MLFGEVDGRRLHFCSNAVIGADGMIYLTLEMIYPALERAPLRARAHAPVQFAVLIQFCRVEAVNAIGRLKPTSTPVPAASEKKQNNNDNDEKCRLVHVGLLRFDNLMNV